jgi:hypothetical protein
MQQEKVQDTGVFCVGGPRDVFSLSPKHGSVEELL